MNRTGIATLATLTTLGLTLLAHAGGAQTLTQIGSAANISSPFNPPLYEASGLGTAKNQSALQDPGLPGAHLQRPGLFGPLLRPDAQPVLDRERRGAGPLPLRLDRRPREQDVAPPLRQRRRGGLRPRVQPPLHRD